MTRSAKQFLEDCRERWPPDAWVYNARGLNSIARILLNRFCDRNREDYDTALREVEEFIRKRVGEVSNPYNKPIA